MENVPVTCEPFRKHDVAEKRMNDEKEKDDLIRIKRSNNAN